jgi:hypothetical protein
MTSLPCHSEKKKKAPFTKKMAGGEAGHVGS